MFTARIKNVVAVQFLISISFIIVILLNLQDFSLEGEKRNPGGRFSFSVNIRYLLFGEKDWFRPRRSVTHALLVTQMRSGSSFTAHLLMESPSTFYTEEPIRELFGDDAGSGDAAKDAVDLLRDILKCNFSWRPHYFSKRVSGIHHHNPDTKILCFMANELCWNPATSDALCSASRVHLVRLVSLDLAEVIPLLKDPDLNVKVIHLVRDPRGTFASRNYMKEINIVSEALVNVSSLCQRHRRDLQAAMTIAKDFPDRYTLLRYEDLCQHMEKKLRQMYQFLGVSFSHQAARNVAVHTLGLFYEDLGLFSYEKNSSIQAFKWRKSIPFQVVTAVQEACEDSMQAYGYRIFKSEDQVMDEGLNPLVSLQDDYNHLDRYHFDYER